VEIEALKRALAAKPRKIGDSPSHDGLTCTAIPMSADGKEQAFLIVCETSRRFWQLSNRMRIVDLIAGAASSAFKRVAAQTLAEEARIAAESEKLRSALLESISHDLKTPLAVVLGSASSLKDLNSGLSERDAQELLQAILDEGARLDQFIGNLLDMTRVESEALRPKRELADLNDIIGSALRRASRSLAAHRVELKVPADLPSLEIDPVLMEKALFNILENAANYTPAGTRVTVSVLRSRDRLILQVWDEGQGIPQRELSHIFEKFYRGGSGSWKPAGTGLGLSITRGFVQAMGGEITASNRTDHSGAVFTIKLPISKAKWRSSHLPQTCKAS
jgi:two-component system sensor histidine kinase KdpD